MGLMSQAGFGNGRIIIGRTAVATIVYARTAKRMIFMVSSQVRLAALALLVPFAHRWMKRCSKPLSVQCVDAKGS
jgi:hypothetical protein